MSLGCATTGDLVMDEAWMTCGLPDVAAGHISVTLANMSTGTGFGDV